MRKLSEIAGELANDSVLLVDDEEYIVDILKEIISHWIPDIDSVRSGKEALKLIKNRNYDFILSDIRMPDMSGMELYNKIRQVNPELASKVIFFTGDTKSEDVRYFFDLTAARHLFKPFQIRELIDLMLEVKHLKPVYLNIKQR